MRIINSVSYRFRRSTTATLKKTISSLTALTLIAGAALTYQNITTPNTAKADTPPDNCFAYTTSGTNATITDYYDNQDNNSSSPVCPRAVDIPSTLNSGALTVTSIGGHAFSENQLTSVTIPNTITSIGSHAFSGNLLTSVTIPDSIATIEANTFYNNLLNSVTIPESVTTIDNGAFSGNRLQIVIIPTTLMTISQTAFMAQSENYSFTDAMLGVVTFEEYMNSFLYARLYTPDGTNPHNLKDATPGMGGHLINAAPLTVKFVNSKDESLKETATLAGKKADGSYINSYRVVDGPDLTTMADQAAIDEALALYYRVGQTVTTDLPVIDGYVTPEPTARSFVLGASDNTQTYMYLTSEEVAAQQAGASASGSGGNLAATGEDSVVLVTLALAVVLAGFVLVVRQARPGSI